MRQLELNLYPTLSSDADPLKSRAPMCVWSTGKNMFTTWLFYVSPHPFWTVCLQIKGIDYQGKNIAANLIFIPNSNVGHPADPSHRMISHPINSLSLPFSTHASTSHVRNWAGNCVTVTVPIHCVCLCVSA